MEQASCHILDRGQDDPAAPPDAWGRCRVVVFLDDDCGRAAYTLFLLRLRRAAARAVPDTNAIGRVTHGNACDFFSCRRINDRHIVTE